MRGTVICLDISESMGYGELIKLDQAIKTILKIVEGARSRPLALITFDTRSEVLQNFQTSNQDQVEAELSNLTVRGVSCIADGLNRAINLIDESGFESDIILLTDGRANLSLNQMGGFEGSLSLEEELLNITKEANKRGISIHTVAVGEDAFTHTLSTMSKNTDGFHWLAEDFRRIDTKPPTLKIRVEKGKLKVHGAPAELPSAQPTWTKESQFLHVSVVSQNLYKTYRNSRRAFLVNPNNHRMARTALISIESEDLIKYRERRIRIADEVRSENGILLDRSYRDFLALNRDDTVKLIIY